MTTVLTVIDRPEVGDRVKFADDRFIWTVAATSEHFTALTRPAPFRRDAKVYTVIDWDKGFRGPCNLIGQGWGDGTYTPEQCTLMLADFENMLREDPAATAARAAGKKSWKASWNTLEVSYRNRVTVHIDRIDKARR